MNKNDLLIEFGFAVFAALMAITARLGYFMFQLDVNIPEDPQKAKHWARKRRWLAVSELLAVPLFAIIAVSVTHYFELTIVVSVLISMALGALGFGFFLNGLQWFIKEKLGMNK